MHLDAKNRALLEQILAAHVPGCEVWAYGSRVHGEHLKPFSDIDLVVMSGAKDGAISALKEVLVASDLPYKVDVTDWQHVREDFRAVIQRGYEVIQRAG